MRASKILIVTQSYPFGDYSDFLEDEIWELVDQFDEIIVAPTFPRGPRQMIPDNVTVDLTLSRRQTRRRRAIGAATALGCRLLISDVRRRPDCLLRPSLFARAVLGAGAAASASRWARRREQRNSVGIAYTYWLSPIAVGLRHAWPGVELVSRAHRGDLFVEFNDNSYLPLHEQSIRACDVVASVSDHGADYLRKRYPSVSDRIAVKRLGTKRAPSARTSDDDVVRIVSCSSLTDAKQPALLVCSILELARRRNVRWDHFGDGPLRSVLLDHLGDEPNEGLDTVLHGQVTNAAVFEHYDSHAVDLFLNCSISEGVPVSIMEAISAGIPIVATNVGGTPEIVQPVCGTLIDPASSPAQVADAMQELLADPGSAEDRVEFWSEHYNAAKNYRGFAAWLRELADRQSD